MDSLGCKATSCSRELAAQGPSSLAWLTRFKLLFSRVQHHCSVYTRASQCAQVQYTSLHGDKQKWINYCCLHKIATGDIKNYKESQHENKNPQKALWSGWDTFSGGMNINTKFHESIFCATIWCVVYISSKVWSLWCEPPTAGSQTLALLLTYMLVSIKLHCKRR